MYNQKLTLKELVDRDATTQNGFGYKEFVKLASLSNRPSYTAVAKMFNKNARTIKKWFERYDEEVK